MATSIKMPRQGQSVESCILTEWYKNVGDQVSKGELLFAYETDKAAFEEEAQDDGLLLARFYDEGDEVPVLVNVAVIGTKGEPLSEFRPDGAVSESTSPASEAVSVSELEPEPVKKGEESVSDISISQAAVSTGSTAISPRARRLAKERRVLLDGIAGSGPGGRIIERDIENEIKSGKRLTPLAYKKAESEGLTAPEDGKTPFGKITSKDLVETTQLPLDHSPGDYKDIPLSNVRKIIASAMYNSLQNSAQLTHHLSANASKMLQLRKEVKRRITEGYSYNITLNDMVCYAVIRALKIYPEANAQYLDGKIRQFNAVNLGMAVDTERGLLVPSLPAADNFSLPGLSSQLTKLVNSSRGGSVSPDLLSPEAATFTVSNLGNYGVEMFTPVINLPQVAILGVNTIIQRPTVLEDGTFGFQPFIGLSLTYDHRAIDGGPATQFLAEIKSQVEKLSVSLL